MTDPKVDHISNMTPLGWSGGGHFHWYTERDEKGHGSCPVCTPGKPWRLTRRGWVVVSALLVAFSLVGLWWALTTGQAHQCAWFKQHGTADQIQAYCTSR